MLPDGGAEQSPAAWWQGIVAAAQRVMDARRVAADDVVAVAVTSQWSGTVPIDRDGTPLHDAIIWMDARRAAETRRVVGGALRVQGYEPRKLRTWISRTGGAPALSGKDSISHILWLQARTARHRAGHVEVPRAQGLAEPSSSPVGARRRFDSIVLHWVTDNRDPARVDYDPDLLRIARLDRAQLPDLVPATVGRRPADGATRRRSSACRPGIPVVGGTPDLQSAAIGSGAVRDFEGHLYVGTSSWLTCHVPFKKTDLFHGIASLPSPLPGKYYVADEQEVAGGCLEWLRDTADTRSRPATTCAGSTRLPAPCAPGSNGVIFTPWLNGERTPVDDHTLRAGWNNLSLATTRAELVRSVLEGVAYNSRWLLGTVEKFVGRPFPWLHFIGGGAQSRAVVPDHGRRARTEIRQVEHPIRRQRARRRALAGIALGRIGVDDLARNVRIVEIVRARPREPGDLRRSLREFRVLHKQTSRRTKRHGRSS